MKDDFFFEDDIETHLCFIPVSFYFTDVIKVVLDLSSFNIFTGFSIYFDDLLPRESYAMRVLGVAVNDHVFQSADKLLPHLERYI